jgi:hypothetical protein
MPKFEVLVRQCAVWMFATLIPLSFHTYCRAQVSSATLSIHIVDTTGAGITNASVIVRDTDNEQQQHATSDKAGSATFSFLKPGHYALRISKEQFSDVSLEGLTLNIGDEKQLQLMLKVGSAAQTVTVNEDGLTINTADASVSTVIDRKFVENTPLNGRSFQSLILLTPGAVTNSPQTSAQIGANGEFSVNGQRTETNYYTVDGVSANIGATPNGGGAGPGGGLPASTALGTTQALVSVDALQEFRVESSTYSAEYGRSPGGQFSMATRSGTNQWHGSVFDYLRNDVFDANNWFNDNTLPITQKSPERQNDFGGTLDGPVHIPFLYNGKDRTFFFFSYEGLRLTQPQGATVNYVPDVALRASTNGPLQAALNAFPLPNGPDLGNGFGEFTAAWSNPSRLDATSVRIDQNMGERTHLFFRFSNTPSSSSARGTTAEVSSPSSVDSSVFLARTYTAGATSHLAKGIDNDLRVNYSSNVYQAQIYLDNFGGAIPVDLARLTGVPEHSQLTVGVAYAGENPRLTQTTTTGEQEQWNVVDVLSSTLGKHSMKAGMDWRRLTPVVTPAPNISTYLYTSEAAVQGNNVSVGIGQSQASNYPLYTNFSLFAQDEWKATSRLNISSGIRWDVNPAPGVTHGLMPYTISGLDNPATMVLAPQGTSLWKTTWFNIAPRIGVAYVLNPEPTRQTVIRGGGGVFFDTGQQSGSYGFSGPGFTATNYFGSAFASPATFPLSVSAVSPPIFVHPTAPYGPVYTNPSHLQVPYSIQWNVSLEQALGTSQSVSISYVASNGRRLPQQSELNISDNPAFSTVYVYRSGLSSSYNSLQIKYQRQIVGGLQVLGSYTWSHSLDFGSNNSALPFERGNSDYDVRNNTAAAISYDFPKSRGANRIRPLISGWGADSRFTARTGFPVTLDGNTAVDPGTGALYYTGLDIVPNNPIYLHGSSSHYPGGRRVNPAAFALPTSNVVGNAPRNFVRGFGAIQTDLALRKNLRLLDSLQAQFRVEAFNIFNHPNFGSIDAYYGNPQFGEATAVLSQSLGVLSPLYQQGGPRSLQMTLKLVY